MELTTEMLNDIKKVLEVHLGKVKVKNMNHKYMKETCPICGCTLDKSTQDPFDSFDPYDTLAEYVCNNGECPYIGTTTVEAHEAIYRLIMASKEWYDYKVHQKTIQTCDVNLLDVIMGIINLDFSYDDAHKGNSIPNED